MRIALFFVSAALAAQTIQQAQQSAKPKVPMTKVGPASTTHRPGTTAQSQNEPALTTDEDKTIYALGLSMYRSLSQFDLSPGELKIIERALDDAAAQKPAVDIAVYGPKIQEMAQARIARLAQKEKTESQAYLDKAAAEPGAVKTPSGMIYREVRAGTGDSPKPTDTVQVNYRGTLVDGTEFDSSYGRGAPAQFALTGVIPCWTEGVQRMKVGGKAQLVCPANLAYGDSGRPGIPPGAALVFEIELLGIQGGPGTTGK